MIRPWEESHWPAPPLPAGLVRAAGRQVAGHARDADDFRALLDVLGLADRAVGS